MSTYGDVRFRINKLCQGVDPELIDGWISDRYQSILDRLEWERQEIESILLLSAPYTTGTVALTNGSSTVTGTATTWTSAMTGRAFRVPGRNEVYEFTYASGTSGTLDRPYEGATATGSAYSVSQHIYSLPADCKILSGVDAFDYGPLLRISRAQMRETSTPNATTGTPVYFATYMDDASDRMQVQFSPIPSASIGVRLTYTAEGRSLSGTSVTLMPWLRPSAIVAGVHADVLGWQKDYAGAEREERQFDRYVLDMIRTEASNRPAVTIDMADRYVRHRRARWQR